MKKHGPPPCGIYNVGSLLMAFTIGMFQPAEPSRAGSERQLRHAARLIDSDFGVHVVADCVLRTHTTGLKILEQIAQDIL